MDAFGMPYQNSTLEWRRNNPHAAIGTDMRGIGDGLFGSGSYVVDPSWDLFPENNNGRPPSPRPVSNSGSAPSSSAYSLGENPYGIRYIREPSADERRGNQSRHHRSTPRRSDKEERYRGEKSYYSFPHRSEGPRSPKRRHISSSAYPSTNGSHNKHHYPHASTAGDLRPQQQRPSAFQDQDYYYDHKTQRYISWQDSYGTTEEVLIPSSVAGYRAPSDISKTSAHRGGSRSSSGQ